MILRGVVDTLKGKIVGKNRVETIENILIIMLFSFSVILSISIGLSAIYPKGTVTTAAMLSSFFIFLSVIFLIVVWAIREV